MTDFFRKKTAYLSSAYFGSIQYYSKLSSYQHIIVENEENYQKQSYRNRCIILAANGPLILSVPVADGPNTKSKMKDLQLSYDHNWQRLHWRSIVSAYNNSPFFEYYADDLLPFFNEKKWKFLIDFNTEIQQTILELTDLKTNIHFSEDYIPENEIPENVKDYRYSIHPKPTKQKEDEHFMAKEYAQVFQEKYGFVANLSILDLLFNEGPRTLELLKSCIK